MISEECSGNRLIGTYRGIVLKHLPHGKCKIFIPSVYDESFIKNPHSLPTAEQKTPLFAGTNEGNGVFSYPNLSSIVWCTFINGDPNFPIFDSATLGGEDAFGQYEIIKNKNEEISKKHMITSGKTHMLWYEKGILSGIVEDPIRTLCTVKYDLNELENNNTLVKDKFSYEISNEILNKIANNKISNINCQYVLDNDANVHGMLTTSTHFYDIINISSPESVTLGTSNIDNRNIMKNSGVIDIGTISSYLAFTTNLKENSKYRQKNEVENQLKMNVPGIFKHNSKNIETLLKLNKDLIEKKDHDYYTYSNQDINGKILFGSDLTNIYSNINMTENYTLNLTSSVENNLRMLSTGILKFTSTTKENILSSNKNNGSSFIKKLTDDATFENNTNGNVILLTVSSLFYSDTNTDESSKHIIVLNTDLQNLYLMKPEGEIQFLTKNDETTSITYPNSVTIKTKSDIHTNKKYTACGTDNTDTKYYYEKKVILPTGSFSTIIDNNHISALNQNKSDVLSKTELEQKRRIITSYSDLYVIDAKYQKTIDISASTSHILIIDNLTNIETECSQDAKKGVTLINIFNKTKDVNTYCTISIFANGLMTINTTDSISINTTNNVTVNTDTTTINSPTVNINGDTTITGQLHVTGNTTIDSDANIGTKSFLGHTHIGNAGNPTSPPI